MYASSRHDDINTRLEENLAVLDVGIGFAFQPLIDHITGEVSGHEALVRGCSGESPAQIIASVGRDNLFYFDQACRLGAVREAARLGLTGDLHINCTEIDPENLSVALDSTAQAVTANGLRPEQIVLEFNLLERLGNPRQLGSVRSRANARGFRVAADNFGSGEAGLKRLAVLRPELVKLDRRLIAGIGNSRRRQAIVLGVVASSRALGIKVVAAGVENSAEVEWLVQTGVTRFQGYFFGRPQLATEEAGLAVPAAPASGSGLNACAA